MNDLELQQMWQAYDRKLDKLLVLNLHQLEQLQTQKASAKMNAFVRNQLIWILLGVVWTGFLAFLVFNTLDNLWFAISVSGIMLLSAYATIMYIKQVVLIRQINITESITATQQKLSVVRASLNQTGRILLLQLPFYCTWFINPSMYKNMVGMCITLGITVLFIVIAIWLYQSLAPKNILKPWVQKFNSSFGGQYIVEASNFLNEIEDFKKEI